MSLKNFDSLSLISKYNHFPRDVCSRGTSLIFTFV